MGEFLSRPKFGKKANTEIVYRKPNEINYLNMGILVSWL